MDTEILLDVKGLSKSFPGVKALNTIDFQLRAGSVHAVCGENGAGKSTLMNIIMGLYRRDEGEVYLKGTPVDFLSPRQALKAGVSIIEQELDPVQEMTVAENMFLGRENIKRKIFIDYKQLEKRASEVLTQLELDIKPSTKMKRLSLAQVQLVEIAKAISYNSDILIMDEPTSAIGEKDVDVLFRIIRMLQLQGKGIIYVSHRLNEIFAVSDTLTVFRDGKHITTKFTCDTTMSELVSLMIGRRLGDEFVKENVPTDIPALEIRHFSRAGVFENINLTVNKGEIVGIFGLMGSGRSEFFNAVFGIDPPDIGKIRVYGKHVVHKSPTQAKNNRLAYVTEDRKISGLVLKSSVKDNIALPNLRKFSKGPFISPTIEQRHVQDIVDKLRVKTPSLRQLVSRLSGGNQQKIVLSKWLISEPNILLLDEPTRGIDVGAKREIYTFMSEFAKAGNSIVMISSELPEVMGMSDRILIFHEGKIVAQRIRPEFSQDDLMALASDAHKE